MFKVTSLILCLWVFKCLCEMLLMHISLVRRISCIWLLGTYTFFTTLMLILWAETCRPHYVTADALVSSIGSGVSLLVAVGLIRALVRSKWHYRRLSVAYFCLLASEVALAVSRHFFGCPLWLSILGMETWTAGILWLAWEAYKIPRPTTLNWRTIAHFMREELTK